MKRKRKVKKPTKVIFFGQTIPLKESELWRFAAIFRDHKIKTKGKTIRQVVIENGGKII